MTWIHTTHAMGRYDTLTYCGRIPARLHRAVWVTTPNLRTSQITCLVCNQAVKKLRKPR